VADGSRERLARISFLVGFVLLALTLAVYWVGPSGSKQKTEPPSTRMSPAMVPLVTGEEPLPQLFARAGCPVCHTIPGIPGAEGRVGPPLALGQTGPVRLADPNYRGQAQSVHEYVIESILAPSRYVVPGYPDRTMPPWYGQKLSATALEKIATYLESLNAAPIPSQP